MSEQQDDFARKYLADFQLLAISCGRTYGALALGGLSALNALGWALHGNADHARGAVLGILGAWVAYGNFTMHGQGVRNKTLIAVSIVLAHACGLSAMAFFMRAAGLL